MSRRSIASLAIAPATVAALPLRPHPPAHLSAAAASIWREVTGSRPPAFFDAGSRGLLEAYSRSLAEHRRIMAVVEKMQPENDAGEFCKLSRIADAHAGRVSQLATRMRLSQQSRTDSRGAGRAVGDHRNAADRIRANYGAGE